MKCPKCGYISFDFNQICPKCSRDITTERDKLHLPPFRPDPPSLLGALTGEGSETSMGMDGPGGLGTGGFAHGDLLSPDDSQAIEAMDDMFKDSQDMEIEFESSALDEAEGATELGDLGGLDSGLDMDQDEVSELTIGEETEELSLDLEDLPLENPEFDSTRAALPEDEELLLEPDVVSMEDMPDKDQAADSKGPDTGEATLDLGDLSLDDSELSLEDQAAGLSEEEPVVDTGGPDASRAAPSDEDDAEEISFDLESLDLDLDLEEEKDK